MLKRAFLPVISGSLLLVGYIVFTCGVCNQKALEEGRVNAFGGTTRDG